MKFDRSNLLAVVFAVLAAGCAPLQQAPLVYSSKQSLGIDFSTATTEQPGLALNLGFKSVDAAYVPVAVAKPCDDQNREKCSSDIYKLEQIRGNRNITDSTNSKEMLEEAQRVVATFEAATALKKSADLAVVEATGRRDAARTRRDEAQGRVTTAQQLETKAKDRKGTSTPGTPESTAADEELSKAVEALGAAKKSADAAQQALVDADTDLATKAAQAQKAKAELDKLPLPKVADALKLVATAASNKADAYSVFGSFSANTAFGTTSSVSGAGTATTGNTVGATAGVALGKIFSTGVASQNLTEGIQAYYTNIALAAAQVSYADCMNAVTTAYTRMGFPADGKGLTPAQLEQLGAAYTACHKRDVKSIPLR